MIERRSLVKTLLADRTDDLLAVASLGSPAWDLTASGHDDRNFCFVGAMGQAAPFALGLAMSQPDRRIVLFCGDGETLMSFGSLATIANTAPPNLAIIVLNNAIYGETGGQPTATAGRTHLEAVALACGFAGAMTAWEPADVEKVRELMLRTPGPVLADVKVASEMLPLVLPKSIDGATQINAFREAVLRAAG